MNTRLSNACRLKSPSRTVELAHLNDLSVIPLKKDNGGQRDVVEALLFGAGRPLLLFPEAASGDLPDTFDQIAIAWDNKGPAARAVADALPFLRKAKMVRLVTIENEGKTAAHAEVRPRAICAKRWVVISRAIASTSRSPISMRRAMPPATFCRDYAIKNKLDLLVMGAYGHARLKEIILGGTTDSILRDPPGYVLMSR